MLQDYEPRINLSSEGLGRTPEAPAEPADIPGQNETEYAAIYSAYVNSSSHTVKYYNPGTGLAETFTGFVENFAGELIDDNGTTPNWNISFEITSM